MKKILTFTLALILVAFFLLGTPARAFYTGVRGELRENQNPNGDLWYNGASVKVFDCVTLATINTGTVDSEAATVYGIFDISFTSASENRTICIEVDFNQSPIHNPPNFVKGPYEDTATSLGTLDTGIYSSMITVTNVDLDVFQATAETNRVVLKWETSSERNTSAFIIQRSLASESSYQDISAQIDSEGSATEGGTYEFVDQNITQGVRYYYRLKAIHTNNTQEEFSVVSAIVGQAATLTPGTPTTGTPGTPTPTSTLTQTPATIQPQGTPTLTPTPSSSPTSTATPTATSTTTLAPLPTLNLLFPAQTPTQTVSPTSVPAAVAALPPTSAPQIIQTSELPPQVELLGGLIILIWLLLGGFLIFYLRRLEM